MTNFSQAVEKSRLSLRWIFSFKDPSRIRTASVFIAFNLLTTFFDNPSLEGHLPRPFGVFYAADRFRYEEALKDQLDLAVEKKGSGDLDALLSGKNTWTVA